MPAPNFTLPAWLRFALPFFRGPLLELIDSVIDSAATRAVDEVDRLPDADGRLSWLDRELTPEESAVALETIKVVSDRIKNEVGDVLGAPRA